MKKALAMALGAMLVAGSAAPAVAASQIDFSGYYRAYFVNHWNYNNADSEGKRNDSGFYSRLNLDFGFHATDEVSVYWRLRAPNNQRWGDPSAGNNSAAETVYAYGEVVQDWGTISIGRLSSNFGNLGLADLGWQPAAIDSSFGLMDPFDFDNSEMDGIRWANRWDNGFQLVGQFNRLVSAQENNTNNPAGRQIGDEQTADLYTVEGAYFWDGGGASLGLSYLRDHAGFVGAGFTDANRPALKAFFLNPAISHSWGDFSVHFEGKAGWGKADSNALDVGGTNVRGYGLYLDFDYNYGPGRVNLAGWWTSGTKATADREAGDNYNALVDMGEFKPLLIAYGDTSVGRIRGKDGYRWNAVAEANVRSNPGGAGPNDMANHWAIDLNGRHAFNDDIALNWALAYLALNKTRSGEGFNTSKSIGFEADLGLEIQLLDNLKFTTDVGYLFAGKALDGPINNVTGQGRFGDHRSADRYGWYNTLTFSF